MRLGFLRNRLVPVGMVVTLVAAQASAEPMLHHVHGLAFSPDGDALLVPAHIGLAVYRNGRWDSTPGPAHDFTGLSIAKNAIYTSGHPAPGSPLRNPIGLMKSTDGGKTWKQLGLYGEAGFHDIAAGYRSKVVYVISGGANSKMPGAGVYYTRDEGRTWKRSELGGIVSPITGMAAHPSDPGTIAVSTFGGLFISRDFGQRFRRHGPALTVTAVLFEPTGKHLLFANEEAGALVRATLDGSSNQSVKLPALATDLVTHIAQNPADRKEVAIATRRKNVFLSPDAGNSWKQIAREGEGL